MNQPADRQKSHTQHRHRFILGLRVDETCYAHAARHIVDWAQNRETRYVCVANVHMVMEAYDCPDFQQLVNAADLVTPDGVPLVWTLRALGAVGQERVYGPDLMLQVCRLAEQEGQPVGFIGGRPEVLKHLIERVSRRFPNLRIVFAYSPPFERADEAEETRVAKAINASGAAILFVGLGCPKQERWMSNNRGRVDAVMVGVGAAFDLHAGVLKQAPPILQRLALEWLFRLAIEPRRLWRRYLKHNPRFLVLTALQLTGRQDFG